MVSRFVSGSFSGGPAFLVGSGEFSRWFCVVVETEFRV